jgi:hypothetical protein
MTQGTGLGIIVSLVVTAIAAANLALDFDLIDTAERERMPAYMEWYCARWACSSRSCGSTWRCCACSPSCATTEPARSDRAACHRVCGENLVGDGCPGDLTGPVGAVLEARESGLHVGKLALDPVEVGCVAVCVAHAVNGTPRCSRPASL